MATTEQSFTGNGSTTNYSFTFPYLKSTDIVVQLDATATTNWSLANATTVQFTAPSGGATTTQEAGGAPKSGVKIKILRKTNVDNLTATFYAGSAIKSEDLNDNYTQNLYVTQEIGNRSFENTGLSTMIGNLQMGEDTSLVFEGATDDGYETTLTVADPSADRTITLPNVTGTVVTTGDTGTVTATMLAANSVDSSELVDGSVDLSHMSANSVDSDQYVDGSIDHVHLANDIIDGDNIQDNAINSEHYTDGSIDEVHLANGIVTFPKLAANSVASSNIVDDTIVNADIKSDAAIAFTKLENLDSAKILVGNGSNKATEVAVSGDVTIANTGEVTIATGAVETGMLAADAVTSAKLADDACDSEHYTDGSIDTVHIGDLQVTTAKIAADAITSAKLADDACDSEHYTDGSIDTAHIADANVTLAKVENVSSGQVIVGDGSNRPTAVAMSGDVAIAAGGATTIQSNAVEIGMIGCEQTTISDSDSHIPTSGAVVDYVAAQIAPIGGLEVIANKDSFPETQPASGVVISIADAQGIVVNGSGTSTTPDTITTDATVTINNINSAFNSATVDAGVGWLVTSTGSGQIYNYHKANIKESDVVQLSDDINDFNSRYRTAANRTADNSNTNDDGDLFFDQSTNKMYVYDGAYDSGGAWKEVTSAGDYKLLTIKDHDQSSGGSGPTFNGSNEEFDLFDGSTDASITSAGQLIVSLNGVIQKPNTGTFDGSEEGFYLNDTHGIKFCDPPPSGSSLFVTQIGTATTLSTPSDNSVTEAKIAAGAVSHVKLAADCVDGDNIQDDVINSEHIAAGAVDLEHMSSESVDEDNLHISNAGSNGQFLSKQSGNSGGLTWADGASEGTDVKSTGESGGTKFLREDGDGTCSWQAVPASGMPTTGGTFTGDVTFDNQVNAGVDVQWDESANAFHFQDGAKANFGASSDMSIQHVSDNSLIQHNSGAAGDLLIRNRSATGNGNIYIEANNGTGNQSEASIVCMGAGQRRVKFYFEGSEVCKTDTNGLAFPSGKGIDFSANTSTSTTGAAMTSELLDWYEEGTFEPKVTFGNTSDFSGGSYGTCNGVYTRVGRLVTISFTTSVSAKGSSSGLVHINGLPFTSGSSTFRGGGRTSYSTLFSTETDNVDCQLYLGDSRTYLQCVHDSLDNLNASDCNNSGAINTTMQYQVP